MAIEIRQGLKLSQQLLMTPQLQQAIKLLQLSRLELEEFVASQLAENPVLEEGATESSEIATQVEKERERTEEQVVQEQFESAPGLVDKVSGQEKAEIDWEMLSRYQESSSPASTKSSKSGDDEMPNYENIVTKARTLAEHLMTQVGELDFNPEEKRAAQVIIGNIDDRGYLRQTLEELAQTENLDITLLDDILDTIQRLDPPGVAARDLKECLLIQLRNSHLKNGLVERIVEHHMHDLETRNYQAIAKALKVPLDKVLENAHTISELEPVPGRQFGSEETHYIVPDVYVFKLGSEWIISLNEDGLPKLKISNLYKGMLNTKEAKGKDKDYIQDKVKSAEWLIKSIQQRQKTIFRVSECIVTRQKEFFENGIQYMKPMILRDIAEDISMHESTISRVTTNKYMHTPRGIFELKYFFNSGVSRADGQDVASESVKTMITDLVKVEDTKKPLSDQRIVELLEEKGIQLARRTVAKYREQLNILPSSKRKKHF